MGTGGGGVAMGCGSDPEQQQQQQDQLQKQSKRVFLRWAWTWKTLKTLAWREHPSLTCPTNSTIIMNVAPTLPRNSGGVWTTTHTPAYSPPDKSLQTAPNNSKSRAVWRRHEGRGTSLSIHLDLLLAISHLFPFTHSRNEANAQVLEERFYMRTAGAAAPTRDNEMSSHFIFNDTRKAKCADFFFCFTIISGYYKKASIEES